MQSDASSKRAEIERTSLQMRLLKQNAGQIRQSILGYVQAIAKEKKLKSEFVIKWCSFVKAHQYVASSSASYRKILNDRLFNFIGYFMARRIQVRFRRYLRIAKVKSHSEEARAAAGNTLTHKNRITLSSYYHLVNTFTFYFGSTIGQEYALRPAKKLLQEYMHQRLGSMLFLHDLEATGDKITYIQQRFRVRLKRKAQKYQVLSGYWDTVVKLCYEFLKKGRKEQEFVANF